MNKRHLKKSIKKILEANLNIKHYADSNYTDPCEKCKYLNFSMDEHDCRGECDPLGNLVLKFECFDLLKIIDTLLGLDLNKTEIDISENGFEETQKQLKLIKYYLRDYYGVHGYNIILEEEYIEIPNKYCNDDEDISIFNRKYKLESRDYIKVVNIATK